jgi:N-acetyl-anhydromuramyl-L-alanine amidase AmpD
MNIIQKLIQFNHTKNANKPAYIVIHDTGNSGIGANAEMHYRFFNGGNRSASAHYFVDDKQIVQIVKDEDSSWHCGDGYNKYGINNNNSIGIEICINSDGNYNIAVSKAIELTQFLMRKHNISIDKVVRHYDASRKNCPQTMSANNWSAWNEFKNRVSGVLSIGSKGNVVKELQEKLIKLGYDLGSYGADGDFGNATNTAVRKFQTDNKLTVNGIVDKKVIDKIEELLNPPIIDWKLQGLKELSDVGIINDYNEWVKKIDEPAPNWLVFTLMNRIYKAVSKK